jgi:3-hydroxybutyryl-CoA dehydratase
LADAAAATVARNLRGWQLRQRAAIIRAFANSRGATGMSILENFTFDEMSVGQKASYTRTVTNEDVLLFAAVSGDTNPVHLDEEFAAATQFKGRIAHGMYTAGLISAAIAMELPGPGTIYLGQDLRFERPVRIGDTITVDLEITEMTAGKNFVKLATVVSNQNAKVVVSGSATVMAPPQKMRIERPAAPRVSFD